ncbi:hypothetical protein BJ912DRAFT_1055333 [Pholiota molesta]|nr:hypothetical protein BJ912DRAFT_1055333 [Pholiota molesta]
MGRLKQPASNPQQDERKRVPEPAPTLPHMHSRVATSTTLLRVCCCWRPATSTDAVHSLYAPLPYPLGHATATMPVRTQRLRDLSRSIRNMPALELRSVRFDRRISREATMRPPSTLPSTHPPSAQSDAEPTKMTAGACRRVPRAAGAHPRGGRGTAGAGAGGGEAIPHRHDSAAGRLTPAALLSGAGGIRGSRRPRLCTASVSRHRWARVGTARTTALERHRERAGQDSRSRGEGGAVRLQGLRANASIALFAAVHRR